jgi:hypothetical protein
VVLNQHRLLRGTRQCRRRIRRDPQRRAYGLLLRVSPRTLHRQLKEEGASLQLKDEARRAHARPTCCCSSHRPIKQVAEAAGSL